MKRSPALRDKEPHIANLILQCLRTWKERCGPRPMIITDEDIQQLETWAVELSDTWDNAKMFYVDLGVPFRVIPEQIGQPKDHVCGRY